MMATADAADDPRMLENDTLGARDWAALFRSATYELDTDVELTRDTVHHTLRGLEIITPQAMHTHTARRAKSEAAREADFDEHRWDVRAFGCAGHDGRAP